jgi:hypothetical protein
MALTTRRQFVQCTAVAAAALCGCPVVGWLPDRRNCRPNAWRRRRSPDVEVRRCLRQPGIGATCDGGRKPNRSEPKRESGSFLGDSRRRGKLRSGDRARVPAPPGKGHSGGNSYLPTRANSGTSTDFRQVRRNGEAISISPLRGSTRQLWPLGSAPLTRPEPSVHVLHEKLPVAAS